MRIFKICTLQQIGPIIRMIKLRSMRWKGHVAVMGLMKSECKCFVEKPEGRRSHGISRYGWEDTIKMGLTGIGSEAVDWVHVTLERDRWRALVNTVMNLLVT
jgi:hypothetical protein